MRRNHAKFAGNSRAGPGLFAAVSLISVAAGCAAVTGLGDYSIDDGVPDASLTPTEAGGTSGTSASGDSGSTPPGVDGGTSSGGRDAEAGSPVITNDCAVKTCGSSSGTATCGLDTCDAPSGGGWNAHGVMLGSGTCMTKGNKSFVEQTFSIKPPYDFDLRFTFRDNTPTDGTLVSIDALTSGGGILWSLTVPYGSSAAMLCSGGQCTDKRVFGNGVDTNFLVHGTVLGSVGAGSASLSIGADACNLIGTVPIPSDKNPVSLRIQVGCTAGTDCNAAFDDVFFNGKAK